MYVLLFINLLFWSIIENGIEKSENFNLTGQIGAEDWSVISHVCSINFAEYKADSKIKMFLWSVKGADYSFDDTMLVIEQELIVP
ncbi:MAG: hypothetical protein ACLFPE_07560 [Bacteroidales bacterium]